METTPTPAATWRITSQRPDGLLCLLWQCGEDQCTALGAIDDFGRVLVLA